MIGKRQARERIKIRTAPSLEVINDASLYYAEF
jgi:hypothetical protein